MENGPWRCWTDSASLAADTIVASRQGADSNCCYETQVAVSTKEGLSAEWQITHQVGATPAKTHAVPWTDSSPSPSEKWLPTSMSWSIAQIVAPLIGTNIIAHYGFNMLWFVLSGIALVSFIGFRWMQHKTSKG